VVLGGDDAVGWMSPDELLLVLASGAPVDLAPAAFGPGDLRRTRLGQVAAAFWIPEPEVFDLACFRSVADFVTDWLANAARSGMLPRLF
jgi:sarcosine oxidase subunit gamma